MKADAEPVDDGAPARAVWRSRDTGRVRGDVTLGAVRLLQSLEVVGLPRRRAG